MVKMWFQTKSAHLVKSSIIFYGIKSATTSRFATFAYDDVLYCARCVQYIESRTNFRPGCRAYSKCGSDISREHVGRAYSKMLFLNFGTSIILFLIILLK